MDDLNKVMDALVNNLTPEQKEKLEKLSGKIPNPQNMTPAQAMSLINELGLDVKKLQKTVNLAKHGPKTLKPRIGANDTCPCGSGRKYKKCCRYKEPEKKQEEK